MTTANTGQPPTLLEKLHRLVGLLHAAPSAPKPPADAVAAPWGAFTLANDRVFDSALALFESLQTFAPGLPLRIIPYDERQDRLAPAARRFGYEYFESPAAETLHRLGQEFFPTEDFAARVFRKLACFEGPFERFLFVDSDVVALGHLAPLFRAIEASGADLVHFDTDLDEVYRPGPLRDRMVARGARGFNSGVFASRRGAVSVRALEESLHTLGPDWSSRLVGGGEQPFLNFHVDRAGLAVRAGHELLSDHCSTCWPAVGRIEFDGAAYRLRDSGRWDEGWQLFFAHWAGFPLGPEMPNRHLFEHFHRRAEERLRRIESEHAHD